MGENSEYREYNLNAIGEDEAYLNEVIKHLELEDKFSTVSKPKPTSPRDKKSHVSVINHKKAHNTAILLGHLRLPIEEIKKDIINMDTRRFSVSHIKQLLSFAPDDMEVLKLDQFVSKKSQLSEPDRFALELSQIPGYKLRINALLFKATFKERQGEIHDELTLIKDASKELRESQKLAKVLELVLAMGNYMNQGNQRVEGATGFKISILTELDTTKTSDNKSTFLHMVAKAVHTNVPDVVTFGNEITTVNKVAKSSLRSLKEELDELSAQLQLLKTDLELLSEELADNAEDNFLGIVNEFIEDTLNQLEVLTAKVRETEEEFSKTAQYFGEDAKDIESDNFFNIFALFTSKFCKAHNENLKSMP